MARVVPIVVLVALTSACGREQMVRRGTVHFRSTEHRLTLVKQ